MPVLTECKCKNCNAPLDMSRVQGNTITCEYCMSVFTLPAKDTSPAALDFLRTAEHELDTCAFDRAFTAYAKAAELAPDESEAYFGMALATFRVQFIRDEVNDRLQPICHEMTDKVFTRNPHYRKALELANAERRKVYEQQGQEINYIREEFLALKEQGIAYDCFLCVKVTDNVSGGKTADYYIANELYTKLKEKGYRPFFSETVLSGQTGGAYEAHILYALKSAECMLLICSNEEFLQTKWVKNEYTRFRELMLGEEKDRDSLVFVYNGRPIEKLPNDSRKLQGIDYGKNDAYLRIVDFVEKHTPAAKKRKQEEEAARKAEADALKRKVEEQAAAQARQLDELKRAQEESQRALQDELKKVRKSSGGGKVSQTESLRKRADLFLQQGDFDEAAEYYNRVLDEEPEHARAWWGLFLAENKMRTATDDEIIAKICQIKSDFDPTSASNAVIHSKNLNNAIRFADGATKKEINAFLQSLQNAAEESYTYTQSHVNSAKRDSESKRKTVFSMRAIQESAAKKWAQDKEKERCEKVHNNMVANKRSKMYIALCIVGTVLGIGAMLLFSHSMEYTFKSCMDDGVTWETLVCAVLIGAGAGFGAVVTAILGATVPSLKDRYTVFSSDVDKSLAESCRAQEECKKAEEKSKEADKELAAWEKVQTSFQKIAQAVKELQGKL